MEGHPTALLHPPLPRPGCPGPLLGAATNSAVQKPCLVEGPPMLARVQLPSQKWPQVPLNTARAIPQCAGRGDKGGFHPILPLCQRPVGGVREGEEVGWGGGGAKGGGTRGGRGVEPGEEVGWGEEDNGRTENPQAAVPGPQGGRGRPAPICSPGHPAAGRKWGGADCPGGEGSSGAP